MKENYLLLCVTEKGLLFSFQVVAGSIRRPCPPHPRRDDLPHILLFFIRSLCEITIYFIAIFFYQLEQQLHLIISIFRFPCLKNTSNVSDQSSWKLQWLPVL